MTDDFNTFMQQYNQANAKPVAGNELQSQTQTLNSAGSINLENAAASGFASSTQGPLNEAFGDTSNGSSGGSSTSSPTSSTSMPTASSSAGQTTNSGQTSNGSLGLTALQTAATNSFGTQSNPSSASSSTSGLSNQAFQTAVSKLGSNVFGDVSSDVNGFGEGLGFGAGNLADSQTSAGLAAIEQETGTFGGESVANAATGSLSDTSLMGIGESAGLGALGGGLEADLLGENPTGGSIGGGLGAAVGDALFPGVGGLVGGALGGAVGGLFGNSTAPTSASNFGENLGMVDSGQAATYTSKNNTTAINQQVATSMNSMLTSAQSALGVQFNQNINLQGGYNTLYSGNTSQPGWLDVGMGQQNPAMNPIINFVPGNSQSVSNAAYEALTQIATLSGYSDTTALYNWFYGQGSTTASNSSYNAMSSSGNINIAPMA